MKPDNSTPEINERWEEEEEGGGGKNQMDGESPRKRAGDRGGQRTEDGLVRGAGCRECGVPGLPEGARRGEDGR